ncbi:MAG TPA: acyltransferase, partial [Acidimicrobiia bacterium]
MTVQAEPVALSPSSADQAPAQTRGRIAYQPPLDGIRALAVLAVIAYHLNYGWAKGGFLGVDVFFVLSGYLITTLLLREWDTDRHIDLVAFWGRRARRLFPALLLVLLAAALAAVWFTPADQLARLRGDAIAALLYVANWRFILSGQSYFDLFNAPSPLRHLWSLAIEEQFYLLWPPIVYVALRARRSRRVLGLICVVGIIASAVCMAMLFHANDVSRAYYGTDSRCQTILVGCLLAVLVERRRPTARSERVLRAVGVGSFAVILLSFMVVNAQSSLLFHGGSAAFAVASAGIIAGTSLVTTGPVRRLLSITPLRGIGKISYGLYLWHWPLIVWLTPARLGLGSASTDVVRVAATFACAIASYFLVELPIRRRT